MLDQCWSNVEPVLDLCRTYIWQLKKRGKTHDSRAQMPTPKRRLNSYYKKCFGTFGLGRFTKGLSNSSCIDWHVGVMLAWCHVAWCHVAWCQAFNCTCVAFFLSQGAQLLHVAGSTPPSENYFCTFIQYPKSLCLSNR